MERVSKRLDGWRRAYFSLGGRLTLVQACLFSIPIYYLSLFKIPVGVAKRVEKMMRTFFGQGQERFREII